MTTTPTATTRNEESALRTVHSGVRELIGAEVLVIDKDERVQNGITQLLSAVSLHVTVCADPADAWERIERTFFSVVLVDLDSPTPNAGIETTQTVKLMSPTSMVIVLSSRKSFDDAVRVMRAGAMDIVLKTPESVVYLKDRVLHAAGRSLDAREVDSVLVDIRDAQEAFLARFMAAERKVLELHDKLEGRSMASNDHEEIRILVVSTGDKLCQTLAAQAPDGYRFEAAHSGGQALDRANSARFHMAMVADDLTDLPSSMVVRSMKTQHPELLVLAVSGPGPGGRVELVETSRRMDVLKEFSDPAQLIGRLAELSEAFHARARERRYAQAFKEKHYDFLRKFVEIKAKIDRALE